eukprot:m.134870 g.134870  ORF g.134870 m.134870 type:complete len:460 (+) comp14704_c0_seq8:288-1667(+)
MAMMEVDKDADFLWPVLRGDPAHEYKINDRGPRGSTALIMACTIGTPSFVSSLLDRGADPELEGFDFHDGLDVQQKQDGVDGSGPSTPLISACYEGHRDVALLLLQRGANVNNSTWTGGPLYYAAAKGHVDIVHLLVQHKADVNLTRTDTGTTPVLIASDRGCVDVVRALADYGADLNRPSNDGTTALIMAAALGNLEVVRVLLSLGVQLTAPSSANRSPLFMASAFGHWEIIKELALHGADVNEHTEDFLTPLGAALTESKHESAKILIAFGAMDSSFIMDFRGPIIAYLSAFEQYLDLWSKKSSFEGNLALAVAAFEKYHDIAAYMIKSGKANPEDCQPSMLLKLAKFKRDTAPDLFEAFSPLDDTMLPDRPERDYEETLKLMSLVSRPWSRASHHFYSHTMQQNVFNVLLIVERLWRSQNVTNDNEKTCSPKLKLPLLPLEIWEHILSFYGSFSIR